MRRLGVPFEALEPTGVDESAVRGPPGEVCRRLAVLKAVWGAGSSAGGGARCVIGADTVVELGDGESGELLGKPADDDDARRMLRMLSGRTHRVLTGVAVVRLGAEPSSAVEVSEVRFRELAPGDIDAYVATGDPRGKAGAYGIQSGGECLVGAIRGCYYNIVGLPLALLSRMLPPELGARAVCDCAGHPLQEGDRGCGRTWAFARRRQREDRDGR